jgi:hypothetical protein
MKERDYFDPKFYGTENYWKHWMGFLYTDSLKYFCETYKAFWTLDVVGSYMPDLKDYDFLVICFDVDNGQCNFTVREDSNTPIIIQQFIESTDLTVSVRLFMENKVLLFPSDH